MFATNYSSLRQNMKSFFDRISDEYETMIVTRKNNKNLVILSEDTYNNILENAYVRSSEANYKWILESKSQLENGNHQVRELILAQDEEDVNE